VIANNFRGIMVRLVSVALICTSCAQVSFAGMVGTEYLVHTDARAASLVRVTAFLARADVARQLQHLGVDPVSVESRLSGLTDAEVAALDGQIDRKVAGGDALAVIGTVFLVLLILELVGVTDVFKRI
jgi:hypothetical protein